MTEEIVSVFVRFIAPKQNREKRLKDGAGFWCKIYKDSGEIAWKHFLNMMAIYTN
jgi:hypothetical protein